MYKNFFLYIIFFGFTGSGKSTRAKELIKLLTKDSYLVAGNINLQENNKFNTKIKRYFYSLICIFTDRETFKEMICLISFFFKVKPFKEGTTVWYFEMVFRVYLSRKRTMKFLDFDILVWENIYHYLPYFGIGRLEDQELKNFLKFFLPKCHILIIDLLTTPSVAYNRAIKRKQGKIICEHSQRRVNNHQKIRRLLIEISAELNSLKILQVSGKKTPKEDAQKIYKFIKIHFMKEQTGITKNY